MKVLVCAASRHGSTDEIARAIAVVLRSFELEVDLFAPDDVDSVSGYDAVIIGSAVYAGHWLRPAVDVVARHRDELVGRPVFLFSSGPLGEPLRLVDTAPEATRSKWTPSRWTTGSSPGPCCDGDSDSRSESIAGGMASRMAISGPGMTSWTGRGRSPSTCGPSRPRPSPRPEHRELRSGRGSRTDGQTQRQRVQPSRPGRAAHPWEGYGVMATLRTPSRRLLKMR